MTTKTLFSLLLLMWCWLPAHTQDTPTKEIIIVKKVVTSEGKEVTETKVLTGELAAEFDIDAVIKAYETGGISVQEVEVLEKIRGENEIEQKIEITISEKDNPHLIVKKRITEAENSMRKDAQIVQSKKQITVDVEDENGTKKYHVTIEDNKGQKEVLEWQGEGELPDHIRKEWEAKGVHIIDFSAQERTEGKVIYINENGEEIEFTKGELEREEQLQDEEYKTIIQKKSIIKQETTVKEGTVLPLSAVRPLHNEQSISIVYQGAATPLTVSVFAPNGKMIYQKHIKDFGGTLEEEIKLKDHQYGVYEVRIKQKNDERIFKVNY